jgi:hypothetical protein
MAPRRTPPAGKAPHHIIILAMEEEGMDTSLSAWPSLRAMTMRGNVVMLLAAKGPDRRNISPKSDAIGDADVCC